MSLSGGRKTAEDVPEGRGASLPVARAVVFAALAVLIAAWLVNNRLAARQAHDLAERLGFEAEEAAIRIEERFRGYRQVLRSVRALFAASESVSPTEWRVFVRSLQLDRDYRGVLGLGFSTRVTSTGLAAHLLEMRTAGFPDYAVSPPGERDEYAPVSLIEPLNVQNRRAVGIDNLAEPVRREAIERARQSRASALSAPLTLIQDGERKQASALLFMPVFAHADGMLSDADDSLVGWISLPFHAHELVRESVGRLPPGIRLRVHDAEAGAARLLFDSLVPGESVPPSLRQAIREIPLDGRRWILQLDADERFAARAKGVEPEFVLVLLIGVMFVVVTWSLSMTRERARILAEAATHDPLTGIANRQFLAEQLRLVVRVATRYGHRGALLYIDLDRFKEVNDRFGHLAGDDLLLEAVRRMQGCLRDSDLLSRHGGDEFLVLLPRIAEAGDAEHVAEKIRAGLAVPFQIRGETVTISASIGIVRFPEDGDDEDVLLSHADVAMYQAKSSGRNQVCHFAAGG